VELWFFEHCQSLTYLLLDAIVTVLVCQNSCLSLLFHNLCLAVTNIMHDPYSVKFLQKLRLRT
jgi:hypothetical protein